MKTHIHESVRQLTKQVIEPLNSETERLFKPIQLKSYDHLEIKLAEQGKLDFILRPFGREKRTTTEEQFGFGDNQVLSQEHGEEGQLLFAHKEETYAYEDCNCSWAAENWFSRLPEARRNSFEKTWHVAGTDFNALVINALWPSNKLVFVKNARTLYDYLVTRFFHQAKHLHSKRHFYLKSSGPKTTDFMDSQVHPLMPFQKVALVNSMGQDESALFMEQGTGKTPIVIARICNESLTCDHMYRALIVCPKNVRSNWMSEFQKFASLPGKTAALRGGKLDRVKILIEAMKKEQTCMWTAVVCSYDIVERTWEAMKMIEWDLVVLDESHYVKSTQTARWKQMIKLRDKAKARMCLTGTPVCNTMMDLFAQFEFLGEGLSGFKSLTKFRHYYGRWERRGCFNTLVGYNNMPLIQERLMRLSFQITKADALPDLPEKVYDVYEVNMTKEQIRYYVELRDKLVLEIEAELEASDNKVLTARNALVKLLRLAQITSGFITWDVEEFEEQKERVVDRIDPNPKIEALIELLKNKLPTDKTIIWACWRQDIKTITARLKLEEINCVQFYGETSDRDREQAVERFNKDLSCKVFVGNPSAGGVGLNLLGHDYDNPNAGNSNVTHVIYFSQNWSMPTRSQSEDRCHRKGTRTNVRYTDLCVPGTIDEEIRARVVLKRESAREIQDVKTILQRILNKTPEINGE